MEQEKIDGGIECPFIAKVVDKVLVLLAYKKRTQHSVNFAKKRIENNHSQINSLTVDIEKHARNKADLMIELNDTHTALNYILGPYKHYITEITEQVHSATASRKEQAETQYRASALLLETTYKE